MSVYEFGPFRLDAERLLLLRGGEPIALGPKVVETLLALIEHPGDVLTKNALLDRIWPEGFVDEANLAQNVYVLRKTLRACWDVEAIETIPRRGYRFVANVARLDCVALSEPTAAAAFVRRRLPWPMIPAAAVAMIALLGALGIALRTHPVAPALSADGARSYQIGRYYWNLRTADGIAKSVRYFERVVDSDPQDARGYAALASADAIMGDYGYGPLPPKVYFARARAFARKALAIDPKYGEAYAVLGLLSAETSGVASDQAMVAGLVDLRRAIELDPTSGPAHEWYGIALLERGRFNQAYDELSKAGALDPLSVSTAVWLGNVAYLERRYGDAIDYSREALDLSPHRSDVYETLGLAYEARGHRALAIAAYRRMAAGCPQCAPQAAALLAEAYALSNQPAQARAELAIARAHAKDVHPEDLAIALAAVGKRSVALSWLRHAGANTYMRAVIASDPRFDRLRGDLEVARAQKPA